MLDRFDIQRFGSLSPFSDAEPALIGRAEISLRYGYPAAGLHVSEQIQIGIFNQKLTLNFKRLGDPQHGKDFP